MPRRRSTGQGGNILANNALAVVSLYRDIYGIQPKYNRLYLEPHLTEALNGTSVKYWLRGHTYKVELSMADYAVTADSFRIQSDAPFGMGSSKNQVEYFKGNSPQPALRITRGKAVKVQCR